MFQDRRIELGNGKVHALVLVGDAVVRRIARRIKDLLPSLLPLVRNMTRETLLKVEQSLLVLLNSHGCSNSGSVARNAFWIILFDGIGRGNSEAVVAAPLDHFSIVMLTIRPSRYAFPSVPRSNTNVVGTSVSGSS